MKSRVGCGRRAGGERIVPFPAPLHPSDIHLRAPSLHRTITAAVSVIQGQFQPNFMARLDMAASDPNLQTLMLTGTEISLDGIQFHLVKCVCVPYVDSCC